MAVHCRTSVPHVMSLFAAAILTVSGCSETPSAATPASASPNSSMATGGSEPVNSGDENGPAVSSPLEEPPVESNEQKASDAPEKG